MTMPQPPGGQGPVDPRGAYAPPPPPQMGGAMPPRGMYPPGPPMMMPPPYYPPPPPAPRGRSFAGAIFTTLATSIFGLSILLNIWLLIGSGALAEDIRHETIVDGSATELVAVIPIRGAIDDRSVESFDKLLTSIESNASLKALVIQMDSPGGGVTQSDEIYARILRFKEARHIPVVTTMGSLGASGGYYIACATDYIFAENTTWTGSIGVLMPNYNVHELIQKWGIRDTTVVSEGATFKTAGSMTEPENPEHTKYFQGIVNQAFDRFKDIVKTGRGSNLVGSIDAIANGKIYTAKEAKDLGLIDQIDYAGAAYDWAAKKAGLTNKRVVKYEVKPSLFGALGGDASFGGSSPRSSSVTINGVNFNLDRHVLDDLATPRLMYLWRGQ